MKPHELLRRATYERIGYSAGTIIACVLIAWVLMRGVLP